MNDISHTNAVTGVAPPHHGIPTNVMQVSGAMVVLTWAAFGVAAFLLHRLAWKPILRTLDKRETDIRASLEKAQRAREEAERSENRSRQIVEQATEQAQALLEETRLSARKMAENMEVEAREQTRRLMEQAAHDIESAKDRAMTELRRESGRLAVDMTERILQEELSEERRRVYTERMIKDFPA
jgi:F-type H+-transporting ATPase subunit b